MSTRARLRAAPALLAALLVALGASAQEPPERPRASEVLRAMSDYLAAQQHVRFHIELNYDVIARWGGKVQLAGAGDVRVKRPNLAAFDYRDDVSARRFWYDGETVTLLDPERGFYARAAAKSDIDATVDEISERYGLTLPVGEIISNDPYAELAQGVEAAYYLGLHDVDGTVCHHLAFVQDRIDWQLWVELGERPVPRKIVVNYKQVPGEPQYVANLMDWEFGREAGAQTFRAELPQDALKIEFLELRGDVPR